MDPTSLASLIALFLIVARWAAQFWLERLNQKHVLKHAGSVPEAFSGRLDAATYSRSVEYTLAKSRLNQVEEACGALILLAVVFSGSLPWVFQFFVHTFGASVWSMAGFVFATGVALSLTGLPFDWYAQFHLEARFGFNTTTPKLWWSDRAKGLLLAFGLGFPLIALILRIVEWAGAAWWVWAWASVLGFQLLMIVLAPSVILPLFNKFSPLSAGSLRDRLHALAERTHFHVAGIQVMDGSKRSRHSNAFFTGFGRFRKIVLFDTLIQELTELELESVLAHEIGHWKKRHVPKMLAFSAASLLIGFCALAWLAEQAWFYEAFGFQPGRIAPALLLVALLSGGITFWFSPLANAMSRRHEYEADAYAAGAMGDFESLVGALRKLTEKNLGNLTPHPLYSGFYYSHPTLIERETALVNRR